MPVSYIPTVQIDVSIFGPGQLRSEIGGWIDSSQRIIALPGIEVISNVSRPAIQGLAKQDVDEAFRIVRISRMIRIDETKVPSVPNCQGADLGGKSKGGACHHER